MHLISPLAGGITIAANGFARLYRRGTTTRATWYNDFEASGADSSGADIPLDSNGSVIAYVNELVQVRVYDSLGELQRDFVAGDQAYTVEVISLAFTGTDYTTGQRAVSKPTTAGAIFDLWLASAGAIDWQGLYSGSAKSLQDIFGAIYGMFFNVKSPEFGAKGDGTTNDTASWQAAHDAALAAGGGIVVAPPGTYLISAGIEWSTGVSLWCPAGATLKVTAGGIPWIHIAASLGAAGPTIFRGLTFDASIDTSHDQLLINHNSADEVIVDACHFGASSHVLGPAVDILNAPLAHITLRDCVATVRGAAVSFVDDERALSGAFGERLNVEGCSVTVNTAGLGYTSFVIGTVGALLMVTGTRILIEESGTGGVVVKVGAAADSVHISGCSFISENNAATIYAVQLFAGATVQVGEDNHFSGFPVGKLYLQAASTDVLADDGTSYLQMMKTRVESYSGTTDTVENYFETYVSESTNAGPPTITMPLIAFFGQRFNLVVWNNSAGSNWATPPVLNPSANAGTDHSTPPNLLSGHCATAQFIAINKGSLGRRWTQIGDWADNTT